MLSRRLESEWGRVYVGVIAAAAALLAGCGDCSDEIAAAQKFLDDPANLACQADADCVVVGTGCETFARGVCAQSPLRASAAQSSKWRTISDGLDDCSSSCTQCLVGLEARCQQGFCGGPP